MPSAMPPAIRERFEAYKDAPLTWHPTTGGRRPLITWNDSMAKKLGPDPDGHRFAAISARMLGGHYYPPDSIEFFGPWMELGRDIRVGDRILQGARLLPFSRWPVLWAMTEVFAAEKTDEVCTLGYVTTQRHFGRGTWQATLERKDGALELTVRSLSGPQSWLFWVGLPVARYLQLRAWRRAFEEFAKIT